MARPDGPAALDGGRLVRDWYVLLLAASLLTSALLLSGVTTRLDNAIYDVALRLRHRPASADIVIVGIDSASLAAKGDWPWPRNLQAAMLRNIARDHPRAIACDILFQSKRSASEDRALHDAMTLAPVFLPEVLEGPANGHAGLLTRPIPDLASAAAGFGLASSTPDADGIVRRAFLSVWHEGQRLPEIMLEMSGKSREHLRLYPSANSGSTIPKALERQDEILISFAGPPGHYHTIPAARVADGAFSPGVFRGKYVLVGGVARDLLDNYPTPVSGAAGMPNVEVEANILDALLTDSVIRPLPRAANLAISLGLVWVLFFGILRFEPRQMAIQGPVGSLVFALCAVAGVAVVGVWFAPMPAVISRTVVQIIWSSRRLQAASDYFTRELDDLQARPGGGPPSRRREPGLLMGDSIARQMMLIDETRRRIRGLRRFVADVLANFPDPVFVVSPRGRIVMFNQAATNLARRLGRDSRPGARIEPILRDLERTAGGRQSLWPPPVTPGATPPRGIGPGGRILEARYTLTGQEEAGQEETDQKEGAGRETRRARGWTVHLVDVTDLIAAMRQREEALQLFTHDMRAPQSAILAILDHPDFQDVPPALREGIERNALRTLSLADGFVRLAQAEAAEYAFAPADLFHIVGDAADALWPIAQAAGVDIVVDDPGREFVVRADRGLLARALINLLDNAVKFSPPGKSVTCRLMEAHLHGRPAVACAVTDQASGMSQEQQKSLFKRFARSPGTGDDDDRGRVRSNSIGLGLAVVHTVVTRHDGAIECRSEVGEGTVFTITLPLCEEEDA